MASGTIKAVIPKSDIVNNLTTNDSTKVLSAAQGYALNSKLAYVYGDWSPNFPRDTATNVTAKYARIGNVMICSAKWTNVHISGQGASYLLNLPSFSGASRITGFHGVWHAGNDIGGECGSNPISNSFWFETSGVHTVLPDSTIEFVAFGIVQDT